MQGVHAAQTKDHASFAEMSISQADIVDYPAENAAIAEHQHEYFAEARNECEAALSIGSPKVLEQPEVAGALEIMVNVGTEAEDNVTLQPLATNRTNLSVDTVILRGIDLRKSLRSGGLVWRKSPSDMPEQECANLWAKSSPVEQLDIFLSHTWWTSGHWKVLSLLFQTGLSVAAAFYLLTLILILALYRLGALPMFGRAKVTAAGEEMDIQVGFFLMICCPTAALLGLLLSPYMPHVFSKPVMSFLDVVCIHQTNEDLKTRGVYGLGGFLKSTNELRVLWSQPYLSRLWCVFELAAYRKANPTGKIKLCPLYIEYAVMVIALSALAAATLSWLAQAVEVGHDRFMIYPLGLVPLIACVHTLRRNNWAKLKLLDDLASFELTNVSCRSDFDRDFVYNAIAAWYGSTDNFTEYVRGPLRAEFVDKVSTSAFPFRYACVPAGVTIVWNLERAAGMHMAGMSPCAQAAYLIGSTIGLGTLWFPLTFQLLMFMCYRFAMARSSKVMDVCLTFFICAAFLFCFSVGREASLVSTSHSLGMACVWAVFAGLSVWFAFDGVHRLSRCWCLGGSQAKTQECTSSSLSGSRAELNA